MTVIKTVIMPRHLWVSLLQFGFVKENWEMFLHDEKCVKD